MSGWIKIEKDLATDPRFMRIAKRLRNADVTLERINDKTVATLLSGALQTLWVYADTHIREDDTLDLGTDEIDELVGIQGFATLMPIDWLEVIDAQSVKLPGFQEHNGTEAKKKALTQKRVERHRIRTVTQERVRQDESCNALALPDQTRPDQTKTRPDESKSARGEDVPREADSEVFEHVGLLKAKYPPNAAREDWIGAERHARRLVEDRLATWHELEAGVDRYAAHCRQTGRLVLNPSRFFGDEDRPWSQLWPLPPGKSDRRLSANQSVAEKFLRGTG